MSSGKSADLTTAKTSLSPLNSLWRGLFVAQRWTIGTAAGGLGPDASWIRAGRLLEPLSGGDFLADPFIVPDTGGRVLLCEWMRVRRGQGVIARVELGATGSIVDIQTIIDWPPFHLSYPHVFRHEGVLYCCPESCHSRSVRLYELSADARQAVKYEVILDNFAAVDPTLFHHDGRYWLMCTRATANQYNTHLHAFHSSSMKGPWIPHAQNPIVIDAASARPAGRVFREQGRLFRPAQDCSERYGGGLRLMEIERLTPDEYIEKPVWGIYPPLGPHGKHGVHTVNADDGVIVYDAYSERFSPLAWLHRLRERQAARPQRRPA